MIILDTNVLSEMLKASPAPSVETWLAAQRPADIFTTAITQAEILYGISLLPIGRRRADLEAAVVPIFEQDFAGRVLPFGGEAAMAYARIAAARQRIGRPISQFDAQIAAIAVSKGASIATRNIGDFVDVGVPVINPWDFER